MYFLSVSVKGSLKHTLHSESLFPPLPPLRLLSLPLLLSFLLFHPHQLDVCLVTVDGQGGGGAIVYMLTVYQPMMHRCVTVTP